MVIQDNLSLSQKLEILSDAAKYDVACTSSGSDRAGVKGAMGSTCAAGICHSFAADGRCISLLKILLSNECVFDCKYCLNRASNDVVRTSFTPDEVCTLTMEFYKRNYIEGLFLSSGVVKSPNHTMELMYEALFQLRHKHHFMGYIHVKGIPGADPALVEKVGFLADRMSLNLELPTGESLKQLAPHKSRKTILTPMRHIQQGIRGNTGRPTISAYQATRMNWQKQLGGGYSYGIEGSSARKQELVKAGSIWLPQQTHQKDRNWLASGKLSQFVPAGQSTQMIIGATPETDYQIMAVSEALYKNYDLKRVFYSAYIKTTQDSSLPALPDGPPLLREHRLYQADWLLRYYGFEANELLSEERPNFNVMLDPKCDWALRHLELFPVEINRADYMVLMRVPGIGMKSAERICRARKSAKLDFADLKRLGVVLKRAHYFITCTGKMMYPTKIEENYIASEMITMDRRKNWEIARQENFKQLSLFDDYNLTMPPTIEDSMTALTGQL